MAKGQCDLQLSDLLDRADGLHLLLWPQAPGQIGGATGWVPVADWLTRRFAGWMHLLLTPLYDGRDASRFAALETAVADLNLPTLASAAPRMHHGNRRKLGDVPSAIRLRSGPEMHRLFAGHTAAVQRAGDLA